MGLQAFKHGFSHSMALYGKCMVLTLSVHNGEKSGEKFRHKPKEFMKDFASSAIDKYLESESLK